MRDVFFAAVGEFDGAALGLHRQFGGLPDDHIFESVAKAAAHHQDVHMNALRVKAGDLGHVVLHEARDLRAGPDIDAVFGDKHRGVDRFERGMGEVGSAVVCLDHVRVLQGRPRHHPRLYTGCLERRG